jgi:hypothetical protein
MISGQQYATADTQLIIISSLKPAKKCGSGRQRNYNGFIK